MKQNNPNDADVNQLVVDYITLIEQQVSNSSPGEQKTSLKKFPGIDLGQDDDYVVKLDKLKQKLSEVFKAHPEINKLYKDESKKCFLSWYVDSDMMVVNGLHIKKIM